MAENPERKQFTFICGCPRSGTTALWDIISAHEKNAIGCERFNHLYPLDKITPDHFSRERFFSIQKGDTFYEDISSTRRPTIAINFRRNEKNYDRCMNFGDKFPFLYEYYPFLLSRFPGCRIVFIMRNIFDVANSYLGRAGAGNPLWPPSRDAAVAVREWNRSLQMTKDFLSKMPIHIVRYEHLFFKKEGHEDLFRFLGLDITDEVRENYHRILQEATDRENTRRSGSLLTSVDKLNIMVHADFETYRFLYGWRAKENE